MNGHVLNTSRAWKIIGVGSRLVIITDHAIRVLVRLNSSGEHSIGNSPLEFSLTNTIIKWSIVILPQPL